MKQVIRRLSLLVAVLQPWFHCSGINQQSVLIPPLTWGILADGGGGPIDGTVDWSEFNNRLLSGYSSTTPEIFDAYLEFELDGQLSFENGTYLELPVIHVYDPATLPFQLFGYLGNGVIDHADFGAGVLLADFILSPDGGLISLDVTSFVASLSSSGEEFAGFSIRPNGDPYVDDTVYFFGTPNQGGTSSVLSVIIPEPTTLSLLGLGSLTLVMVRRKR